MLALPIAFALAGAAQVRDLSHLGHRFQVVEVSLAEAELKIGWARGGATLREVKAAREKAGASLVALMNGGIFEPGFVPTGLLVSDGAELQALNARGGRGNFFTKPNGVFYVDSAGAGIRETGEYARKPPRALQATQSGPLLLRAWQIPSHFSARSSHRAVRNAVGVGESGAVFLVISREPVTMHELATLFRDRLRCSDALYLDGNISALWASGASSAASEETLDRGPFSTVLTVGPRRSPSPRPPTGSPTR